MSGEFPRVMWGGGVWFGDDAAGAEAFALWLLHKGYMVMLSKHRGEVQLCRCCSPIGAHPATYAFQLHTLVLDEWKETGR